MAARLRRGSSPFATCTRIDISAPPRLGEGDDLCGADGDLVSADAPNDDENGIGPPLTGADAQVEIVPDVVSSGRL